MLFKFPKEKIGDNEFNHIKNSWNSKILYWIIDYRFRKSYRLSSWLSSFDYTVLSEALKEIPNDDDFDKQVIHCLRWVKNNITYVSDKISWDVDEKWQSIEETIGLRTGDCEDGAILLYWLCRFKGVPANRLYILAGDVDGGGHCWLGYKPTEYPLNWIFLDWCYWYNANNLGSRSLFYINEIKISEYTPTGKQVNDSYYKIWFAFNEEDSYTKITY
jgi:transglutaminase-like putative cysteine protease